PGPVPHPRGLPPLRRRAAGGAGRGGPRGHGGGGAGHRRRRAAARGLGPRRPGDHRGREGPREVPGRGRAAARGAGPAPVVAPPDRPRLTAPPGPGPGRETAPAVRWGPSRITQRSLLVATLVAGLAKQLAVLLLGHALATLLDDRTHRCLCSAGSRLRDGAADQVCAARGDCTELVRVRRHGRPAILHCRPASSAPGECEIPRSIAREGEL